MDAWSARVGDGIVRLCIVRTHMKPAPPVTMMFFTSGRGSNLVVPVRTGAFFQTLTSCT